MEAIKSESFDRTGPITLDLKGQGADAVIKVCDDEGPSVRVFTESSLKGIREAVLNTRIELHDEVLSVHVANPKQETSVAMSGGTIIYSGGNIVTGAQRRGSVDLVRLEILIPSESAIRSSLNSSGMRVMGSPANFDLSLVSGSASVYGMVGSLRARITSGSLMATRVRSEIDALVQSGSLDIGDYNGRSAIVDVRSGQANLEVGRNATGTIDITVLSGVVEVVGAKGNPKLDIRKRVSSGVIRGV